MVLAAMLGGFAGYLAWLHPELLPGFVVGAHRDAITLRMPAPGEYLEWRTRFAWSFAFAGASAAVAGGFLWPPGSPKWPAATAALCVLLCSGLTLLALATIAAYYRYQFAQFFFEHANARIPVRPEVWLSDLPLVRIPVASGVTILLAASVTRAITQRRRRLLEKLPWNSSDAHFSDPDSLAGE